MFKIKNKINVLLFALQQLGWECMDAKRQSSVLFEMLERLRIMLVCAEEQSVEQNWRRSETAPSEFQISILSRFKLIDVDSTEEFTDDPVRGYASSTFTNSEEDTMLNARLKANNRAKLLFITNLLRNNK